MAAIQSDVQVDEICRTCLNFHTEVKYIYEKQAKRQSIEQMLRDCSFLEVQKGDGLPSYMCVQCLEIVSTAYAFKLTCVNSDRQLRSQMPPNNMSNCKNDSLWIMDDNDLPFTGSESPQFSSELMQALPLHSHKCKICHKVFTKRQGLQRHNKIHDNSLEKRKLCTFCGKSFLRLDDLKRHTRTHTNERPYSCKSCDKSYKQSSELKEHLNTHARGKLFICSRCGKTLSTRNGLYVHIKVHNADRNYECDVCLKRFASNSELLSHINHIHSQEKSSKYTFSAHSRAFAVNIDMLTANA